MLLLVSISYLVTQVTDMDNLNLTLLGSSIISPKCLYQGWANPGGHVDRRLKFVRTHVIFVSPQYGTCFVKKKWSHYRPGVAQSVGRGIALLFHDRGTRRGWVVSSRPRPHITPGKDLVPILQEAGWAPGLVCTSGKSRPHRDSIPDGPARSQSLYQLSYPAQGTCFVGQ